jgi:hypothetical protein
MELRRLRLGELLALAGAIALLVAMFLPWYRGAAGGLTAWDEFGVVDVLIVIAVAVALFLAVATATERSTALPVAAAVWTTVWGIIATLAIALRLLDQPGDSLGLRAAAWVALVAALAIAAGGWHSMSDERTELYEPAEPEPRAPPAA